MGAYCWVGFLLLGGLGWDFILLGLSRDVHRGLEDRAPNVSEETKKAEHLALESWEKEEQSIVIQRRPSECPHFGVRTHFSKKKENQ